jgi:hypothetical protein
MQTGHKHKKLIRAWAAGAIIQFQNWKYEWTDVENNDPEWIPAVSYRVKPKPDYSKFIGLYSDNSKDIHGVDGAWYGMEYVYHSKYTHLLLCNKLELVFDGETKELKEVKIHSKE